MFILLAAVCYAASLMATAVGDTIPYYYQGDTLWYEVLSTQMMALSTPTTYNRLLGHCYGSHTQPSGVVTIPNTITVDGATYSVLQMSKTFCGLKNIDEVYINNRIARTDSSFVNSSVKKVHLGLNVMAFGNATFKGCKQLDSVILYEPDQFVSNSYDTWENSKPVNSLGNNEFLRIGNGVYAYKGFPADSTLTIPEGVKFISSYCTYTMGSSDGVNIRAVVLPASMTKVGDEAFRYCKNIKSITCLATVPPTAYANSFKTGATSDSYYANLCMQATLYVPWSADHSVLAAYKAAIQWGQSFKTVVELDAPDTIAVGDTIPYYYMGDTLWYKVNAENVEAVTPVMFNYGFDGAANYYGSHTLPAGIVHIPDSVPVNGTMLPVTKLCGTFYGLLNINEVYMNNLITSVAHGFEGCTVKKIHFGAALSSFGNGAFKNCSLLDSTILTSPDQFIVNSYDTWIQSKPVSLLTNDFLHIGNGVYAYKGFPADSTLVIPEGVKYTAGYLTFSMGTTSAANLRAVSLPASLVKMDWYVFTYATGITSVTCLAAEPPVTRNQTFYTNNTTSLCTQATLYVPWSEDHSILAAYQAANAWKDFTNIVELEPEPETCEDYSWTATGTIPTNNSLTLGDYTWTMTYANTGAYFGWNNTNGAQLGSSSNPIDTITFTTSDPANCLIDTVTVNAAMAKDGDAVLNVFIGDTQIGLQSLTNTCTDYSFINTANLKGDLTVRFTNTVKAIYLKSINVSMAASTATAVEEKTSASLSDAVKVIRDGRILILRNGEIFDILGRRVE